MGIDWVWPPPSIKNEHEQNTNNLTIKRSKTSLVPRNWRYTPLAKALNSRPRRIAPRMPTKTCDMACLTLKGSPRLYS